MNNKRSLIVATIVLLSFISLLVIFLIRNSERKTYTFIVPQEPGGGTSVWANIIIQELAHYIDADLEIRHIPGNRDIIGFEKFHNELRFQDNIVMVSHGGNAISYLQEDVLYNYDDYAPIAVQSYNIILATNDDWTSETIKFPEGSGYVPDAMAIALLVGGNSAPSNWNERVVWVKGMNSSERRLAFQRGELTAIRDNPAAFSTHIVPLIEAGDADYWFNHGLVDYQSGEFQHDPNWDMPILEELYKTIYKEAPDGDFYNAYKMAKSWRDGLQKALWVDKNNPNREELVRAVNQMLQNKEARKRLVEQLGDYPWTVGDEAVQLKSYLNGLITEEALLTLVDFNGSYLGLNSQYNSSLLSGKK